MRSISLPLALCVVVFGCGGHDNRQPAADSAASDSAANTMPSDTTHMQGAGAVALPADSAAAVDRTRAKDSTAMTKPPSTSKRDAVSKKKSQSKADSDSARKFKKPEIRPVYPPVDRSRTNQDTSATRDTGAQRDTTAGA
jgi:hypothetical protein